jgi:uncharacterized repeat protein (TIGR01451 family)
MGIVTAWRGCTAAATAGLVFLVALLPDTSQGQYPTAPLLPARHPALPAGVPPLGAPVSLPPLLFVRLAGPAGMTVTFHRGSGAGQSFAVPCLVGFRPGYQYRFSVSNIPHHPNVTLAPTVDVIGSLLLANRLRAADFPATLLFSDEDFQGARAGAVVNKVIVLETPENAVPEASRVEQPIQIQLPPNRDPMAEARERGRPLLVFRMGQRQLSSAELAQTGIPGTVLLPGEKVLQPPRYPPWVPFACYPAHDPLLGPAPAAAETTVYDGGDTGLRAGYQRDGRLRGIDPSDTVAEYTDSKGRKHVACSNRVGLCVPRFVLVRTETILAGQFAQIGPGRTRSAVGHTSVHAHVPIAAYEQLNQLERVGSRQRASGAENTFGTSVRGRIAGLDVKATVTVTGSLQGSKEPPTADEPADGPLCIIKWPDKFGATIGDVVTFFLKYTNTGGQPITNVAVTDSLAARFEYVPGSAKTDREAVFTTQNNDAGSQLLRWEIQGTLQPRESGVVSFQARIR